MPDSLKMPDATTGSGIESQNAVGEEIVSNPIGAVKIERGRSRCREHHPELGVKAQPRPCVCSTRNFVSVLGPSIVTEFARERNRMKNPAELARVYIERANVPRRTGQRLGNRATQNDHVLKNDARAAGANGNALRRTIQALSKIDSAVISETLNRLPRAPVESPQIISLREEDTISRYGHAAMAVPALRLAAHTGVETPDLASSLGVQSDHAKFGSCGVQDAVNHNRVALHL